MKTRIFSIVILLGLMACASAPDPWRDEWLRNAKKPLDTGSYHWWELTKRGW